LRFDDFSDITHRAEWRSIKVSVGPYSVPRMTEHDHRCESTARGVEVRLGFPRLQGGLTQAQLADELGSTQSAIARLERRLHRAGREAISGVATALRCETALLIEENRIA
jgi:hypothetical protein